MPTEPADEGTKREWPVCPGTDTGEILDQLERPKSPENVLDFKKEKQKTRSDIVDSVRSEQPTRCEGESQTNYWLHDDKAKDGCLRPYLRWRYCLKQNGVKDTDYFPEPWPNDVDNERSYPLLNCERHGHEIWMHQAQADVVQQLPTTVTPGHLNFMYSKMARTLRDDCLSVRQKSVQWCVELLCVPENRARCIAAGLLPILAKMMCEKDLYIRRHLALCFKYFSVAITTWNDLIDLGCIKGLFKMLETNDAILRCNALNALNDCALSCEVRDFIIGDGAILAFVVNYIGIDTNSNSICYAIDLCSKCMGSLNYCQKAIDQVLAAGGVPIVVKRAQTNYQPLMESSGRFICLVGFEEKGRKEALSLGAVAVFVPYLNHVENRIMAYGTAALLSLTLEIQGKKDFIIANGVPLMTAMIHLSDSELSFLAMNLIINATEDPAARRKVQHGIAVCRTLMLETLNGRLRKSARKTIQELQFTSRPYQI